MKKNTVPCTKSQNIAAYRKAFSSWLFSRPFGFYFLCTRDKTSGHSWPSLACAVELMECVGAGQAGYLFSYSCGCPERWKILSVFLSYGRKLEKDDDGERSQKPREMLRQISKKFTFPLPEVNKDTVAAYAQFCKGDSVSIIMYSFSQLLKRLLRHNFLAASLWCLLFFSQLI